MSRDLNDLQPEFGCKVKKLLTDLGAGGHEFRPFFTVRTPQEQARLWRQSRSREQIQKAIESLKLKGAPYLAEVLDSVGPQFGRHVTGALPGLSWHQHGLAVDCFCMINGEAEWSSKFYTPYANAARAAGLNAGHFWPRFKDSVHIQQANDRVLDRYSWPELDRRMRNGFG
ncbi:MAG: hypothetical protein Alpg2KO_00730 [Alphaproteobacteria bacterium]